MKLEGSIEELKLFIKEFHPNNISSSKQQLKQIEDLIKKTPVAGTTDVKRLRAEDIID